MYMYVYIYIHTHTHTFVASRHMQGQGLPTDRWPHVHLPGDKVNDHPDSIRIIYGQHEIPCFSD